MAYRKSEHPRIVQIVQPRVLNFWDRSKMTPYHNKLLEVKTLSSIQITLNASLRSLNKLLTVDYDVGNRLV